MDTEHRSHNWRVFLSSTFRDMGPERDELVQRVFPRFRQCCEERGVAFCEVDLRWGIPAEDSQEGKILGACLREIEQCQPFFLCFLGDHYGSLVNELQAVATSADEDQRFEELRQRCLDRSVTELEIIRAVFSDDAPARHALFYFRTDGAADAARGTDPAKATKLASLKEKIRGAGVPLREGYRDARELGRWVFDDLTALLDKLHPPDRAAEATTAARVREAARAFAVRHGGFRVGDPAVLRRLSRHASRRDRPSGLVLTGEAGAGKSALLLHWIAAGSSPPGMDAGRWWRWAARLAGVFGGGDAVRAGKVAVVARFVEALPGGADWRALLAGLEEEILPSGGLPTVATQEDDAGTRRELFARRLRAVPAERRLVVVLDGLDHLDDEGQALRWLPETEDWPRHVRLIVSAAPGRAADTLAARGWRRVELRPLAVADRASFARDYLARFGKRLGPVHAARLGAAPAANARYLRTVLDELRVLGDHALLGERLDDYLQAAGPAALYGKVLARLEAQLDEPALATRALSLLWCARRGLAERELLDLLGNGEGALPALRWSSVALALRELLLDRAGLLVLENRALREAVARRYGSAERDSRRALADYFAARPTSSRAAAEAPWHLAALSDWDGLFGFLSRPERLRDLEPAASGETLVWWHALEENSTHSLADVLEARAAAPDADPRFALTAAEVLLDRGRVAAGERLADARVARPHPAQPSPEQDRMRADARRLQARARRLRGDLDGALTALREEAVHRREHADERGLAANLCNQGLILREQGNGADALARCREAGEISGRLDDRRGQADALGGQAALLLESGSAADALALWEREGAVREETGDLRAWGRSLGNQAQASAALGRLDSSRRLSRAEENLWLRLGDRSGLQTCLGNRAVVEQRAANYDGAMDLLDRREAICRQLETPEPLIETRVQQALLLAEVPSLHAGVRACLHEAEALAAAHPGIAPATAARLAAARATLAERTGPGRRDRAP